MRVKVLFFGATAESVGEREVGITLDEDIKASGALEVIFTQFPVLEKNHKLETLHFAVNQEFSTGDEIIRDGDELAVFTAVSGG